MSITGAPDGDPTKVGVALVDVLTGKDAVIGILAALRERELSGRGPADRGQPAVEPARARWSTRPSAYLTTGAAPAGWATSTPRSRRTRRCTAPTACSPSPAATTRQFARLAGVPRAAGRARRPIRAGFAHQPPRGSSTGRRSSTRSRTALAEDRPRPGWPRLDRGRGARPGRSTTSAGPRSPWPTPSDLAPTVDRRRRPPRPDPAPDHLVAQPARRPRPRPRASGSTPTDPIRWPTSKENAVSSHADTCPPFNSTTPPGSTTSSARRRRTCAPRSASCRPGRVEPHVADWFERGAHRRPARADARASASWACSACTWRATAAPGMSAVDYGLACLELEAGDSGIRSLVSVQGSLAMFAIWRWGSEEQKQEWLPADGRRRGDRLLRPDRARPRLRPRRHAHPRPPRRRRLGAQRPQDVDHQRLDRRRRGGLGADRRAAIRGFVVPTDTPGFSAPGDQAQDVAARLGHQRAGARRRAAARLGACCPRCAGLKGPLSCLNEARYGIVWGALGAARSCLEAALSLRRRARRSSASRSPGFQLTQAKLADMTAGAGQGAAARAAPRPPQGRRPAAPRAGQPRQAQQRARGARDLPDRAAPSSAPTGSRWSTR